MEDPQYIPCRTTNALQREWQVRTELPRTPTRVTGWRTWMGSRRNHGTMAIPSQMEGLLTCSWLMENESNIHAPLLIKAYQQHLESQSAKPRKSVSNPKQTKVQSAVTKTSVSTQKNDKPPQKEQSANHQALPRPPGLSKQPLISIRRRSVRILK